jgi:hypothetical protein
MSNDSRKIRFGLWYDFRNPAQWRQPADRFIEDGYLPSILPAAAAIAAWCSDSQTSSKPLFSPQAI